MQVVFALRATCPAGHPVDGRSFRTARINKNSLRTTDTAGIAWAPPACPCGRDVGPYRRVGLTEISLAEVNAYRAARGWPAWEPDGADHA